MCAFMPSAAPCKVFKVLKPLLRKEAPQFDFDSSSPRSFFTSTALKTHPNGLHRALSVRFSLSLAFRAQAAKAEMHA